ncbi:hypothetical protein M569_02316 [Genlisea aurea]|uniref:Uncharacterized protein n=1 Tax=Genlisea aurea TaxID=192259 RepID=S8D4Z5_9LAMI|nr:hypothetical protein M569_02316 [Genlisea aurea]
MSPKSSSSSAKSKASIHDPEASHLSGACIRSFVKQLSSSRPENSAGGIVSDQKPSPEKPQYKKQVRRRVHTTRPYQERLLNMAEARREIVAALKFHRATMKNSGENPPRRATENPSFFLADNETLLKTRSIYDPNFSNNTKSNLCHSAPLFSPCCSSLPEDNNPNFILPTQTLGLNLNLEHFKFLDNDSIYSPPPEEIPSAGEKTRFADSNTHQMIDGITSAETKSQHQIEWDEGRDAMNSSARWLKFLSSRKTGHDLNSDFSYFDDAIEFPSWINESDGSSCLCYDDLSPDLPLPCMEIEEIEEMDGDWLA